MVDAGCRLPEHPDVGIVRSERLDALAIWVDARRPCLCRRWGPRRPPALPRTHRPRNDRRREFTREERNPPCLDLTEQPAPSGPPDRLQAGIRNEGKRREATPTRPAERKGGHSPTAIPRRL